MPKRMKVERSPNYSYYSDILWCSLPLVGMSCYFYGLRPVLLFLAALLTAYLCDCALAPLHGTGYQSHEPSSECFAALIVLMMPASISYPIVIAAVIIVLVLTLTSHSFAEVPVLLVTTRLPSASWSPVSPGLKMSFSTLCPAPSCRSLGR